MPITRNASAAASRTSVAKWLSSDSRWSVSTAMPVCSMRGEQVDERELDLGQQAGAPGLLDLAVEGVGQVEHGARVEHRRVGDAAAAVSSSKSSSSWPSSAEPCFSSRLR